MATNVTFGGGPQARSVMEIARRLNDEVSRLGTELRTLQEESAKDSALYENSIKPLLESDRANGTAYVRTLRVFLDAFGHLEAAGRHLHVHANTVRYRLGRIRQMVNIDLDDPDERFRLMGLLRMIEEEKLIS